MRHRVHVQLLDDAGAVHLDGLLGGAPPLGGVLAVQPLSHQRAYLVRYRPGQPAEAVLQVGMAGSELFLRMGRRPFPLTAPPIHGGGRMHVRNFVSMALKCLATGRRTTLAIRVLPAEQPGA